MEIALSALGAVTSVGMDATTTCASIRAGLTRPAPLDHAKVLDLVEYKEVPVTGHPAGQLARGFSNVGRWLQLAPEALVDLCASAGLPEVTAGAAFWADTVCIVALPELGERFLPDPLCSDETIQQAFLKPLIERVRTVFAPARWSIAAAGRAGVLVSLSEARRWIDSGQAARAVVLAVDSLVDLAALEWLSDAGRLKSDSNPIGLSPGEAACAVMLEDASAASARGGDVIALLGAVAVVDEPRAFSAGEASQGEALAAAITTVLTDSRMSAPFTGLIVGDLNGEQWRSFEFGCARTRVPRALLDSDRVALPVESIGDAGVATAAVQCAVACRALARRYAGGNAVLVTCSDEHGAAGAAVLFRE